MSNGYPTWRYETLYPICTDADRPALLRIQRYNDTTESQNKLKIRIHNATPYTLENIQVNTGGGVNNYSALGPGEESIYKEFDHAYSIAYAEFKADTKAITIQPIDFVGETLFEKGLMTYKIHVVNFDQANFSIEGTLD